MTPFKKTSLDDVAREAGVSTATVSRVLNETGLVQEKTRELVLRAVAKLRYTPNLHARTLAGGDSRTIGMIVSNLENPFFLDVYRSLESEAQRLGYEVIVTNTGYDPARLVAGVRLMLGRRVTGIAAIVSEMTAPVLDELSRSNTPVVCCDVDGAKRNIINVRTDYTTGMQRMVELLYELGHRSFAFVGHHPTLTSLSVRHQAFVSAMERYGQRVTYRVVAESDALEGGRRAAGQLLDDGVRPTAIVCVNDLMAAGVLRALGERGVRVPQDISVTGFDNVTLADYVTPTLTTLDMPRAEIGRMTIEHLVAPASRKKPRELVITPTLVVRNSTGKAPARTSRKR